MTFKYSYVHVLYFRKLSVNICCFTFSVAGGGTVVVFFFENGVVEKTRPGTILVLLIRIIARRGRCLIGYVQILLKVYFAVSLDKDV